MLRGAHLVSPWLPTQWVVFGFYTLCSNGTLQAVMELNTYQIRRSRTAILNCLHLLGRNTGLHKYYTWSLCRETWSNKIFCTELNPSEDGNKNGGRVKPRLLNKRKTVSKKCWIFVSFYFFNFLITWLFLSWTECLLGCLDKDIN